MFGKLLRRLGLGSAESAIADKVLTTVADRATGGAASKVEGAVQSVAGEVARRKRRPKGGT